MFNDHKFKAPFPWDEGEVGESVHIPKGTVHEKQFTRDTDFLKEKYTSVTKLTDIHPYIHVSAAARHWRD